jgi:hypothetical protein
MRLAGLGGKDSGDGIKSVLCLLTSILFTLPDRPFLLVRF